MQKMDYSTYVAVKRVPKKSGTLLVFQRVQSMRVGGKPTHKVALHLGSIDEELIHDSDALRAFWKNAYWSLYGPGVRYFVDLGQDQGHAVTVEIRPWKLGEKREVEEQIARHIPELTSDERKRYKITAASDKEREDVKINERLREAREMRRKRQQTPQ